MVKEYWFNYESYRSTGRLFPEEIEDDVSILYHGTSAVYAQSIEQAGLAWRDDTYSLTDLIALLRVFCALRWVGSSGDAVTLITFTRRDFSGGIAKPIYLSGGAWQASQFAQRNHAGGETVSAMRRCFDDLMHYIADSAFRNEPRNSTAPWAFELPDLWPELQEVLKSDPIVNLPDDQKSEWVAKQVGALARVQAYCWLPWNQHESGVVYAVRPEASDCLRFREREPGALEWTGSIPADRLVGKIQVPREFEAQCQVKLERFNIPIESLKHRDKAIEYWKTQLHQQNTPAVASKGRGGES